MRTDLLQLLGTIASVLAAAMLASERRLVRRLRAAKAVSPHTAVLLPSRLSPITRFRLARLQQSGAVVATWEGRLYLDAAGYARYRQSRRRRALALMAVAILVMLVLWRLGRFD